MEETTAGKKIGSALSNARCAMIFTLKDKIDIPNKLLGKPAGKPPRKGLAREREVSSSNAASAQDYAERDTAEGIDSVASPRGVLEDSSSSRCCSDSETSFSKTAAAASNSSSNSPFDIQCIQNASAWKGFLRSWKHKSISRLSSFPPLGVPRLKGSRKSHHHGQSSNVVVDDDEFCLFKPSWKTFTTLELQNATSNFSEENLIGKGGFAEVYEGQLEDGQFVAIKRLNKGSLEERTNSFLSELGILVHLNHPNIAKLIGVGDEGLHLVLRLSPHGSLSSILQGSRGRDLEWGNRFDIAVGTAEGLEYLHDRCQRRIIHRDIKAANILLTEDFQPQICDFGLAMWLPDQLSHHTVSSFEGTFGYLAPEYFTHGTVDEKTDVFAYGVLLLELISGRKALDASQQSLLMWAKPLIERDEIKALVDPALGTSYDYEQLKHMVDIASLCTQHSSMLRPKISEVLTMLKGGNLPNSSKCIAPRRRTYSEELFDAEEYNATRYLNDMNRHMQVALDFRGETQ